jgi:hypothetical protein
MAEPPRSPETEHGAGKGRDRGPDSGPPRWMLLLGIFVAIALLGLIIFLHLSGTLGPGTH